MSGYTWLPLPWQIRNYKLTNKIVLTQVSLGFNLIEGDVIGERWQEEKFASIGLWEEGYVRVDSLLKGTGYQSNEPRGDRLLTRVAFDRYLHKPVEFLRRCGINFLTFWYLGETKLKSIALLICQVPLILFGLIGLFKSRSIKLPLAPVLTFLVYFVVLSSMIYGIGRFSVPLIPVLLLFANSVG